MSEQIDRPGISDMEFTITMDRDWFCGGVVNNKWYHKLLRLLSMGLLCPKKYQILRKGDAYRPFTLEDMNELVNLHGVTARIRTYLGGFDGEDLERAQYILRNVINEFNHPPTVKQEHLPDLGMVTTEYPDGRYEVRIDLTKQEEE